MPHFLKARYGCIELPLPRYSTQKFAKLYNNDLLAVNVPYTHNIITNMQQFISLYKIYERLSKIR